LLARALAACCLIPAVVIAVTGCGGGGGGGGANKKISGNKLTIYSSLPEQGSAKDQNKAIEQGAALALRQQGGKVGKYKITYKPLDDSLASTGAADEGKGAQNARTAVQNKNTIGYIGEYNSGISKVTIPINDKGGIPQISPANTYVGLTSTAPGHAPGEPNKYYPTGKRNYVRVVPKDTVQAAALATAMKQDGCKTVHIFNSKTVYSAGLAQNIARVAPKLGLKIEGNSAYDPKAANYRSLVSNVKADCVVQTGEIESNGSQLLKDVAAAAPSAKLYGADGICLNAAADPMKGVPTAIAPRYECTIATLDPAKFGPAGKKFFADFKRIYHTKTPDTYAIYGYESMNLLLDAIKRASASGSLTRQKVIDQLFATRNRKSVIGTYSINKDGDTTLTDYGLRDIKGTQLHFLRVLKASRTLVPPG
jgi:branched-chain amino acid transport system substrate-binding protein